MKYKGDTNTINSILKLITSSPIEKDTYQIAIGFDIETTSWTEKDIKYASMYIWQMSFNNEIKIYGRTWDEFEHLIFNLEHNLPYKIIIYVHNLAYEFQWISPYLSINKSFARKARRIIYCETDKIIFKCSYFLTNMSLRKLAIERGYDEKDTMDYSLKRFWFTPLTSEELHYSMRDVEIVVELIQDEIKRNGGIKNIPMTSTGYVRRYILNYLKENTNFTKYQFKIRDGVNYSPEFFDLLHRAYTGGYTHANAYHAGITLNDISCYDFNSSYPGVLVRKKYPRKFNKVNPKFFNEYINNPKYACIIKIEFEHIESTKCNSIISVSKCSNKQTAKINQIDNGRLRNGDNFELVITDLDYHTICNFYTFSSFKIKTLYISEYQYLPKEIVECVLQWYEDKTTLKGDENKIDLYNLAKALLNAIYGMMCTNPLNDEILFIDGEWKTIPADVTEGLEKYHNKHDLFTMYQWGVWVTAWARYDLLKAVYQIDQDVVYNDTDSIKTLNGHKDLFDKMNKIIHEENVLASEFYGISFSKYAPKTRKGIVKEIGLWDEETPYKCFKTLGAKRYCYSYYDDYYQARNELYNFYTTVSGIAKKSLSDYIMYTALKNDKSPFDVFSDRLEVPPEYSGKQTITYIQCQFDMNAIDYLGNSGHVSEKRYIHMEPAPFSMNLSDDYYNFLFLLELQDDDETGVSYTNYE